MSEREQERELQTALREHDLMLDSMSADEHFTYQRRRRVESCLQWRHMITRSDIPVFHEQLKKAQIRLVRLRAERETGAASGTA